MYRCFGKPIQTSFDFHYLYLNSLLLHYFSSFQNNVILLSLGLTFSQDMQKHENRQVENLSYGNQEIPTNNYPMQFSNIMVINWSPFHTAKVLPYSTVKTCKIHNKNVSNIHVIFEKIKINSKVGKAVSFTKFTAFLFILCLVYI